jgi:CheY-like chemotaxis protein
VNFRAHLHAFNYTDFGHPVAQKSCYYESLSNDRENREKALSSAGDRSIARFGGRVDCGLHRTWGGLKQVDGVTRILVVDDFQPFRTWVSSELQNEPAWRVVADATDGVEAVQKAQELRPELIILDIGLPKLNGIETARLILSENPAPKIIFLSQECSADVVSEAIRLGASGYVVKAHAGDELMKAIRAVLQGKRYVSRGLAAKICAQGSSTDCESL